MYALVGEVLKPRDPAYDRLMGMMIRPHRWFTYIDDGTQLDHHGHHGRDGVESGQ